MDWEEYARRQIKMQGGQEASFFGAGESVHKFGRADSLDADVWSTVAQFQNDLADETYAVANTVDSVVSSSASDTGLFSIDGQYLDGEELVDHFQTVTLAGQTPVPLVQPLARVNRLRNANQGTVAAPGADLVGTVHVFDLLAAGGVSGGVPNAPGATKCLVKAGENGSQKGATSISSRTYAAVTGLSVALERQNQDPSVDIRIEFRPIGGVWRSLAADVTLRRNYIHTFAQDFEPWIIIPPNSDIRIRAKSDTSSTTMHGTMSALLATVP